MAAIYSAPKSLTLPDLSDWKGYEAASKKYIQDLKEMVLRRKKGKNIGEIIRFPVADGYAEYMVASMEPVELIHIPLWDAWEFNYVHLLTAKEVQQQIDQQKAMAKLFGESE